MKKKILTLTTIILTFLIIAGVDKQALQVQASSSSPQYNIEKEGQTFKVYKNNRLIYNVKKTKKIRYVNRYKLNLWSGPNYSLSVGSKIYNQKVVILGTVKDGAWAITKTEDGKYCFCSTKYLSKKKQKTVYSNSYFLFHGVLYWGGWKWTYYSQRILPGYGLYIPGRHVDSRGYVCDKYERICLASTSLPKGTVVKTPFGKLGKVYDTGCAYGTLDVYVNW